MHLLHTLRLSSKIGMHSSSSFPQTFCLSVKYGCTVSALYPFISVCSPFMWPVSRTASILSVPINVPHRIWGKYSRTQITVATTNGIRLKWWRRPTLLAAPMHTKAPAPYSIWLRADVSRWERLFIRKIDRLLWRILHVHSSTKKAKYICLIIQIDDRGKWISILRL